MIEFKRWETIISNGDLVIIDVRFLGGSIDVELSDGRKYFQQADPKFNNSELLITIFDITTESIYLIEYEYIHGYRVLDEAGLLEYWCDPKYKYKILGNTFKIKNSSWSKKSPFLFMYTDNTSYIITTSADCVEVISEVEPTIKFIKKIPSS